MVEDRKEIIRGALQRLAEVRVYGLSQKRHVPIARLRSRMSAQKTANRKGADVLVLPPGFIDARERLPTEPGLYLVVLLLQAKARRYRHFAYRVISVDSDCDGTFVWVRDGAVKYPLIQAWQEQPLHPLMEVSAQPTQGETP